MRFSFGRFVLDSEARELLRDGEPVHLSPKAYQLLETLLANRPRALSKSDLHDRLWPDTFVVETNLANLVVEIRTVIGDEPRRPRFLRTVHGFGYAFRAGDHDAIPEKSPAEAGPAAARSAVDHRVIWGRRVIPLEPGDNVIGRDEEAAVRIEAADVSRRHARIVIERDRATLEDLGSKNGTHLREERLEAPATLADGDVFRVGRQLLVYKSSPVRDSTRTGTD
jgi:DNA-binding winged helix-turn-helix (wHTH) protein